MHAILVSMGTAGDVYPFIGLGKELRARGHKATLVANERYQKLAAQNHLNFTNFVSEEDTQQLLGNADIWHPVRSALVGARWAGVRLPRQYEIVRAAAETPDAVLVAYPPVFAARLVQETTGVPLVSVVPMPWMIPSAIDPPTLAGSARRINSLPRPLRAWPWRALEVGADWLIGRDVNRLQRSLGLGPIRKVARWAYSPELTIAMFPGWYAATQDDWPTNTHCVGFSMFDGAVAESLPPDIQAFCRSGDPPVVFTFGTGMCHAHDLFRKAVEVCRELRLRAVLVSPGGAQIPAALPSHVVYCKYAPFHLLLPECAAIVHHGGLGTTAQALAAGIPQLITPLAWDQYDNAARVKQLGAGTWCKPNHSVGHWRTLLNSILAPTAKKSCLEIVERCFCDADADRRAVELMEELRKE